MPSELLHLPPLYTIVGLYRLLTDPFIRGPVLDKIKHASIRGFIVGAIYAIASWGFLRWFVRVWLVGSRGSWFSRSRAVGEAVKESVGGKIYVGLGSWSVGVDLILYTHLLILLPQISSILRFFIYKNLRLARSRAYALTVSSRGKPAEFWSQGYIEEWQTPPIPGPGDTAAGGHATKEARWISWILWWPTQLFLRHYLLLPLSPALPLLTPLLMAFIKSIQTAQYLHQPYFESKSMTSAETWRWVEERKWAYRSSLLESIPIIGLFLSISNRIGAAMWAFDLEKRQHLFSNDILKPLPKDQVGWFGTGADTDLGVDIQAAEADIEKKWSKRKNASLDAGSGVELLGPGVGVGEKGKEKVF